MSQEFFSFLDFEQQSQNSLSPIYENFRDIDFSYQSETLKGKISDIKLISTNSKKIKKSDKLTIKKYFIGNFCTGFKAVFKENQDIPSIFYTFYMKITQDYYEKYPDLWINADSLRNLISRYILKNVGGKPNNNANTSRDYNINTKGKIFKVLFKADNEKDEKMKCIIRELINFVFTSNEYYNYIVRRQGPDRSLNQRFLNDNRWNIFSIFKDPKVYISKYL